MAMRHRKGAAASRDKTEEAENDADDHPSIDHESAHDHEAAPAVSSALQKKSIMSYVTDLSHMEMEDVYRYWSIFRDFLAEVPTYARRVACDMPLIPFGTGSKNASMSPEQLKALEKFIEENILIPYVHEDHFNELMQLWRLSFPNTETIPLRQDPQWKRLGFQGTDPATDFRSAGVLSVRSMVHFAETYPSKYRDVMMRTQGLSAEESYPFACACINIVFMLIDLMKLKRADETPSSDHDAAVMRAGLARLLERNEKAFHDLFCVCMIALDNEWVRAKGTYMTFPFILKTTKDRIIATLKNPHLKSVGNAADLLKANLYED
jgi:hypothetical protein